MTRLPVLKSTAESSPQQLIRLFHQSQLEWARHLGEETMLDFGRSISNAKLPLVPAANCLLDAVVLPGQTPHRLIEELLRREIQCCVLSPSMDTQSSAVLSAALLNSGWILDPLDILHRSRNAELQVTNPRSLKIIPARASYRHYQRLLTDRGVSDVEASMLHLDDPHLDMLLAIEGGEPVASIGVLTTGEAGSIQEWYVAPAARHRGVGKLMLDRALEIASRAMVRHLMIGLPTASQTALHLCERAGFQKIGQWSSFWKDSCKLPRIFA